MSTAEKIVNLVPQEDAPSTAITFAKASTMTPMDMLTRAVSQGASIEILEKLMGLSERWEASQARKAFDAAMSSAKAEIPVIAKNRTVDFTSQKGRTHYRHEDLAEVARTVSPILSKYGLSYRFRVTSAINEPVSVTCVISHRDGHFEETTLTGPRDESGNKNSIQAVGSTLTYLQRMTLKAALGLAASEDDDGAKSEAPTKTTAPNVAPPPGSVTQAQADDLRDAVDEKGASRSAFLQWAKQKRFEDIPAEHFDACIEAISKFRKVEK